MKGGTVGGNAVSQMQDPGFNPDLSGIPSGSFQ